MVWKEGKMASKTKKLKRIKGRKARPNKANLKKNMERIQRNREILNELVSQDKA
jgi:hypothetical protein